MKNYIIKSLNQETWNSFEQLVEKHNGVWGGCWCTYFHEKPPGFIRNNDTNKCFKKKLVEEGKSHAALVFDEEKCIAWCQFGEPEELPNIYHKKEVETKFKTPDWRITCFFVDIGYRKKGISVIALNGALELIKNSGGGIVESYPQDTQEKKITSSFLYNGTKQIFEQVGFKYEGQKGKNHCVMRILV